MGALPDVPEAIRLARRAIDGHPNVQIFGEIVYYETVNRWAFPIRLSVDVCPSGPVPSTTDWYVVMASQFPKGSLKLFPSKINGLTDTYQHQMNNKAGSPDLPWRSGDLCLATDLKALGVPCIDTEPQEASARMLWTIQRAQKWIRDASNNALAKPGDPFELPDFSASRPYTLGYLQLPADVSIADTRVGVAVCRNDTRKAVFLAELQNNSFTRVAKFKWGGFVARLKQQQTAIWIHLNGIPVIGPWGAPMTWDELQTACTLQGADVMAALKAHASRLRDGSPHFLILGIPIPETVDGPIAKIHWQALEIPALSSRNTPGVRNKERSLWARDVSEVLKGELRWIESEDWSSS